MNSDTIEISIGDSGLNEDIKCVCQDIYAEFSRLVPDGPALGVKSLEVVYNPQSPITNVNRLPNLYSLELSVKARNYAQIAFQFSHELTHVYSDPRTTNWFIESICEMSSFYFLNYLYHKWQNDAPHSHWESYAIEFLNYRNNILDELDKKFGVKRSCRLRKLARCAAVTASVSYNRPRNQLIGLRLLNIFQRNKKAWHLLPLFGISIDEELSGKDFLPDSTPNFKKLIDLSPRNLKKLSCYLKSQLTFKRRRLLNLAHRNNAYLMLCKSNNFNLKNSKSRYP